MFKRARYQEFISEKEYQKLLKKNENLAKNKRKS